MTQASKAKFHYQDRLAVLNHHMEIQLALTKISFLVTLIIPMITIILAVWTYHPATFNFIQPVPTPAASSLRP